MQQTLKYPIGKQNFRDIIEGGYLYVDKTEYIWRLVSTGSYYFLSRPRRFGKSLFLSTIEEYFSGSKELFQGLKISEYEKDWIQYPVIHIYLNAQKYSYTASLEFTINRQLCDFASKVDYQLSDEGSAADKFIELIKNTVKIPQQLSKTRLRQRRLPKRPLCFNVYAV